MIGENSHIEAKPPSRENVDRLLRMLTEGRSSSSVSTNGSAAPMTSRSRPPPLPPKPKVNLDGLGGDYHRGRGFEHSPEISGPQSMIHLANDQVDGIGGSNIGHKSYHSTKEKYDAYETAIRRDNNNGFSATTNLTTSHQLSSSTETSTYAKYLPNLLSDKLKASTPARGHVTNDGDSIMANYEERPIRRNRNTTRPIVTESSDDNIEISNNVHPKSRSKANSNTSTVKILEIPTEQISSKLNTTFTRPSPRQHKLFLENNSPDDAVARAADVRDELEIGRDDNDNETLSAYVVEDSVLNRSSSVQHPPRTSTPTEQTAIRSVSPSIVTQAFNTSRDYTSRLGVSYHHASNIQDGDIDNIDDNIADISKDTDELTCTSGLDASGGAKLIGLNSDRSNNSKDSGRVEDEPLASKGQIFISEVATMSSTFSPHQSNNINYRNDTDHLQCQTQIRELEQTCKLLSETVDRLSTKVNLLTTRLDTLETKCAKDDDVRLLRWSENVAKNCQANHPDEGQPRLSQLSINPSQPVTSKPSFNSPSILRRSPTPTPLSHSVTHKPPASSISRTYRKANFHASMSSLDNPSSAVSNSSLGGHNAQTIATNSLYRKNAAPYTSMVSLTSAGIHSNTSTLKKSLNASGSIANLSQVCTQLKSWPSVNDFIMTKQRGKQIFYDQNEETIQMVLYNNLIVMKVPRLIAADYEVDRVIEPPSARLKLDWVHGYRGRDCRSNLYYLPTCECVYFVGAVVVLFNQEKNTQRHYLGHTDEIKCLAVHPNKLIIATGQSASDSRQNSRPIVRVWNTVSLATLRVIEFNEDFERSISCLAFSKHDQGATIVAVDESSEHTITLLDWQREKSWRVAEANSGHDIVLAIDFHPIDKHSLVAVGKFGINFWDIRGMTLTKRPGLFDKYDKPKYVLCLAFNDLGDTITGDSNGNLIIWGRGASRPKRIIHDAHPGGVFSIFAMMDGSYISGGKDRRIVEWDDNFNRTGREVELAEHHGGIRYITNARGQQALIGTLRNTILVGSMDQGFEAIVHGHSLATSTLAIHPLQCTYLTGGFDEQIYMFDSKMHKALWTKCLMTPATAACFSPNGRLLIVGSSNGKWMVIETVSKEILFSKCEGSGTMMSIKFSPDGNNFCMGSSDMQLYLYRTTEAGNTFYRVGSCSGHSEPIKEIDWTIDNRYVRSQSMGCELLHWRAENCKPVEDPEVIRDLEWDTQNCTIGFNVIGLWSDSNSGLVTSCDTSNRQDIIASVTNEGEISLFKWPTCYNQCVSEKYQPNNENLNYIRFLCDDSKLIMVGSKSCITTEWIVERD